MPNKILRIMLIGDIIGRPGRRAVKTLLPSLRDEYQLDFVVANAENAAGGKGLTLDTAKELLEAGVDVLTSGNHIWEYKDFIPHLDGPLPILRPLNYPPDVPGRGYIINHSIMVVNLMGRVFMGNIDCPFRSIDNLLNQLKDKPPVIIVDFHAEATSEKMAMGWFLDGRVSAVLGTHTHIATVDARILPKGTAYITDVGMVGPVNSVIGVKIELALKRFLSYLPQPLTVASGRVAFNAVLVEVEAETGKALSIQRIEREIE